MVFTLVWIAWLNGSLHHELHGRVEREIAQCDLWFPPIRLPVGHGQSRQPAQLPVLTMVSGYSRWLSAVLIPTRSAADLFAGCRSAS